MRRHELLRGTLLLALRWRCYIQERHLLMSVLSALSILLSSCFFISLSRLERLAYYAKRSVVVVVVVVYLESAELVTAITGKEALFQLNLLAFISPLLSPPPFFFLLFSLFVSELLLILIIGNNNLKKKTIAHIYIYISLSLTIFFSAFTNFTPKP